MQSFPFFQLYMYYSTYLVEVDRRLPELLVGLVEVPHTNLTEVTGMVLVNVGAVVVLTTGHTATTGVLAVLANTTVSGRHMATAKQEIMKSVQHILRAFFFADPSTQSSSAFNRTNGGWDVRYRSGRIGRKGIKKGGTRKLDSRFSVLVQTGRHLVGGAELDKTDLSGWRWRG